MVFTVVMRGGRREEVKGLGVLREERNNKGHLWRQLVCVAGEHLSLLWPGVLRLKIQDPLWTTGSR